MLEFSYYIIFLSNKIVFNSFFASSDFCRLLIYFANNLDPDEDWQSCCQSWSLSKLFDTMIMHLKEIHAWIQKVLSEGVHCKFVVFCLYF